MSDWRRLAAMGAWARIDLKELLEAEASEQELTVLYEVLLMIVPVAEHDAGFETRSVRQSDPDAIKKEVRDGRYSRNMKEVRSALGFEAGTPQDDPESIEARIRQRETDRLAKKHAAPGYQAWQIEQLGCAVLLLQELETHRESMAESSLPSLKEMENYALSVLSEKGIDSAGRNDDGKVALDELRRTVVKPKPLDANSVTNREALEWESRALPPELAEENVLVTDETGMDQIERRTYERNPDLVANGLAHEGWFLLGDVCDPRHADFDTALGHAMAILDYAEQLNTMMSRIMAPGTYIPGKKTVAAHVNEVGDVRQKIGHHFQALEHSRFVYGYRAYEAARANRLQGNPNPRDSMKEETCKVLRAMKHFVEKGQSVLNAARKSHEKLGFGSNEVANKGLWDRWKKKPIFNDIYPLTEEEVLDIQRQRRRDSAI